MNLRGMLAVSIGKLCAEDVGPKLGGDLASAIALGVDTPALDPIVIHIDYIVGGNRPDPLQNVVEVVRAIQYRLRNVGASAYKIAVVAHKDVAWRLPSAYVHGDPHIVIDGGIVPIVYDNAVERDIYILTKSVDGYETIFPVSKQGYAITWLDYVSLALAGKEPGLRVTCPWAQGVIRGVSLNANQLG